MMDTGARDEAVVLLHEAATRGTPLAALPQLSKPVSVPEALSIQDLLVARSGKQVAGWKVATDATGAAMYGAIYVDDCLKSPGVIDIPRYPLMGIEGEIAYRFTEDLPARSAPYRRGELEAVLSPFPALEIVQTRFASYHETPILDRLADRMSNGGMVLGEAERPAPPLDLATLPLTLSINGKTVLDQRGGHACGDPFLPALDFIRAVQRKRSFASGQFITTGTFTGLLFGEPGQTFVVRFVGLGHVEVTIK